MFAQSASYPEALAIALRVLPLNARMPQGGMLVALVKVAQVDELQPGKGVVV